MLVLVSDCRRGHKLVGEGEGSGRSERKDQGGQEQLDAGSLRLSV
jgi:hypothetical protein